MPKPRTSRSRSTPTSAQSVAAIVRALRQRAGLTLNELAQQSSVAASTISKIEGGQLSPGYDIIVRLADGLKVGVAELFRPHVAPTPTARRSVTRKGGGVIFDTRNYTYEVLANEVARKEFLPLRSTIKARDSLSREELPAHEGEEFVFVLKGQITLYSAHYEPLVLNEGDSVYFDSGAGHALTSTSDEDAEIMWICSHREALRRIESP